MSRILKVAKQSIGSTPLNIETLSTVRQFSDMKTNFKLPDLPYDYGALEPVLPARIMELHHSKHHATYVNNLNATLEKRNEAINKGDIAAVVGFDAAIKFNGGGHVNHSIFWTNLVKESTKFDIENDMT